MYYVIGDGLVGGIFKGETAFQVVHRDSREVGDGIVNAAALSGKMACDTAGFDATIQANVELPEVLYELARSAKVPYIVFSSASVYQGAGVVSEASPVYPSNLYVASKILMERVLPDDCFIFRIPLVDLNNGHRNDLSEKIKSWKTCEARETSVVHAETIYKAVHNALTKEIRPGIYNIASEIVTLPDYIQEKYNWEGEVSPRGSLGLSNIPVLDTLKARYVGLI